MVGVDPEDGWESLKAHIKRNVADGEMFLSVLMRIAFMDLAATLNG